MTEIDPDFPYEFLDNIDENDVRAPDAVVREQLIPDTPQINTTTTNNNSGFYSNLPSNVFNMSIEEQIAYIEQLSIKEKKIVNNDEIIKRKLMEEEENRIKKIENMKKMTEEY